MKLLREQIAAATALAACLGIAAVAQTNLGTADSHRAAARAAAGQDHTALLSTVCPNRPAGSANAARGGATNATARGRGAGRGGGAATQGAQAAPTRRQGPPREQWYREPQKVFDNLYFVGQTEYSAWAVTTTEGIIVIDTIFDYSVEEAVAGGLKKLGLDPRQIRYAIISHGHGDHSGGAKYLQDTFGTRILASQADWELMERGRGTRANRDMIITDGQKLTLGDTTITMYLTPGHTPGTVSTIVPVRDNGRPHVMAAWGGTAFNFTVSPERPRTYWFNTYIASAQKFRDAATKAGADGMIANHLNFDNSKVKLPLVAKRTPGSPHPYVIGTDAVRRYLTVAEECAKAALVEEMASAPSGTATTPR
jgi:metallo-beta-lactamase class B